MASEEIDNITARYSVLQSLSASDLDRNIQHTQAMQAQIAHAMSRLEEEPTLQAEPDDQAVQLQQQDQHLAKILEEEMTHHEQMSVLCTSSRLRKLRPRAKKLGNYQLWLNSNKRSLKI